MTTKNLILTFILTVELVFVAGQSTDEAIEEYQYKVKNAIHENNKLNLQFAIENTKLVELNKLNTQVTKKIHATTPTYELTQWQTSLLKKIGKSQKNIEKLKMKLDISNNQLEVLGASNVRVIDEEEIREKKEEIENALEKQQKLQIARAILKTKIEELMKLIKAENIDVKNFQSIELKTMKLSKSQIELLNDFKEARENEMDLIVATAVIKTKINYLKQQFIEAGGSTDTVFSIISYFQKLPEKAIEAEKKQTQIAKKLIAAKNKLEDLQKIQANGQIDSLTMNKKDIKKQNKLLNDIEKSKESINELTVKYAVTKTLSEELSRQLKSIEVSTTISNSAV